MMHSDTNRNEAASMTRAHAALAAAISSPAAALPTRDAVSLAVEKRPWAVVRRSRPTTEGMTEARAGFRNAVRLLSLNIATKATTGGRCPTTTMTTTTAPTTAAAATLVVTMILLRSHRSAATPANGANRTSGICQTAWMMAV